MDKAINFLKDVRVELAKVSWPTKDQMITYTLVVLGMSFFLAIFLGGMDFIFQWVLNNFILN